ncbi:MAG: ATP-dependent transcriptional regulator, partial [Tabrizicola sp.]
SDRFAAADSLRRLVERARKARTSALSLARSAGWQDNRLAFSLFAVGRLLTSSDPARAQEAFAGASAVYASLPGGALQLAHVDMQVAVMALAGGLPEEAARLADRAIPVVRSYDNAALLATLMLIKAEAMEALGDPEKAQALRMDSGPYARYGFGSESMVRSRMRDIATVADRAAKG